MIFKNFNTILSKTEKNFFIELVNLYVSFTKLFCEKHEYYYHNNVGQIHTDKMIEIGVLDNINDVDGLIKFIGKDLFNEFNDAVYNSIIYEKYMDGLLDKLSNTKRKILQNENRSEAYSLVDFFCGAGGLSLGFIQEGFSVKLANDIEDVCIQTYKYNHPELSSNNLVQGDIKDIIDHIGKYNLPSIDIVVGGPPCQGFSQANRQRVIDDPRNKLYKYFLQAVEKIAPKFVVMENVKGMLKVADQVVEDYNNITVNINGVNCRYLVDYKILVSYDFEVAQSRERLIYIAIRSDIAEMNDILPDDIFNDINKMCSKNKKYILNDALEYIKPLVAPRVKNTNEIDSDISGKKIDINYYEDTNEYLSKVNMGRIIPFVFNHKARYVSDINYEIYKRLNEGDDASDEKIKDIMPYSHRLHCFKDKYYKLIANRPSRTITAHLRMDCHSHIHPFQIRAITPREAARIQSFPDDYLFLGAYLKTYMQIGNAVPPMMARGIAKCIKRYL